MTELQIANAMPTPVVADLTDDEIDELVLDVKLDGEIEEPASKALVYALPAKAGKFSYNSIPGPDRSELKGIADRVRLYYSDMKTSAVEIGKELIKARKKLDHGQFGKWIEDEFHWSSRTAYNYMDAAKAVALDSRLAALPDVSLYLIGADKTPTLVKKKVIAAVEKGNYPSKLEISDWIKSEKAKPGKAVATATPAKAKVTDPAELAVSILKRKLGSEFKRFRVSFLKVSAADFEAAMRRA